MIPVSTATLLTVWEAGIAQPPVLRALSLLAPFFPDMTVDDLARLPIGQRDAFLLTVREWLFGPQMECVAVCPACAMRLEFTMNTAELRAAAPTTTVPQQLTLDGIRVTFRLPTSADLLALTPTPTVVWRLVERCLIDPPAALPEHALAAVATAMTQRDPLLEPRIVMTCPGCGRGWSTLLDIVAFVWQEIDYWARRLLSEIHALARAYGWSESDILALSPQRRALYLRLVNDERSP